MNIGREERIFQFEDLFGKNAQCFSKIYHELKKLNEISTD